MFEILNRLVLQIKQDFTDLNKMITSTTSDLP